MRQRLPAWVVSVQRVDLVLLFLAVLALLLLWTAQKSEPSTALLRQRLPEAVVASQRVLALLAFLSVVDFFAFGLALCTPQ